MSFYTANIALFIRWLSTIWLWFRWYKITIIIISYICIYKYVLLISIKTSGDYYQIFSLVLHLHHSPFSTSQTNFSHPVTIFHATTSPRFGHSPVYTLRASSKDQRNYQRYSITQGLLQPLAWPWPSSARKSPGEARFELHQT